MVHLLSLHTVIQTSATAQSAALSSYCIAHTLSVCTSRGFVRTATPLLASMATRVVLVGSSRAGKSTTGNLLLNPASRNAPFAVSHSINSCSVEVAPVVSSQTNLAVVDTPGLGDSPERLPGESDKQYEARCDDRSEKFFNDITTQLRDNGGVIVFVQKNAQVGNKANRHMEALNRVLHSCFSTSVVLMMTNIPEDFLYPPSLDQQSKQEIKHEYYKWLQETSREIQEKFSFKFAAMTAICNSSMLDEDHPAHPKQVIETIKTLRSIGVGLPAGVAMVWRDLLEEKYTLAKMVEEKCIAVEHIKSSIEKLESSLVNMRKQTLHSARAKLGGASLLLLEPVGWLFLMPGLAAGAAAIVAGTAAGAQAGYDARIKIAEASLSDMRQALAEHEKDLQLAMGKSPAELRAEADDIKNLVFGDK